MCIVVTLSSDSCRLQENAYFLWLVVAAASILLAVKLGVQGLGLNAEWWHGMGMDILAGHSPYLETPDNKPPLWTAIHTTSTALGNFPPIMRALSIGAATSLCWMVAREGRARFGSVPATVGVLALTALIVTTAHPANNKLIGAAVALYAVQTPDHRRAAIAAGIAGTIGQQFGLILVAVGVYRVASGTWGRRTALTATAICGAVVASQYAILGLLYGVPTLVAALDQTVFAATSYPAGTSGMPDAGVLGNQGMGAVIVSRARFVALASPLFAVAALGVRRAPEYTVWMLATLPILTLTVFRAYWVFAIPALAMLVVAGAATVTDRISLSLTRRYIRGMWRRPPP